MNIGPMIELPGILNMIEPPYTHVWQHEWAQGKSTSCVARGGDLPLRFLAGDDVGVEGRVAPLVVR